MTLPLAQRNAVLARSWHDARYRVPDTLEKGPAYGVQVLGVVDDPAMHKAAFVDFVTWWPASRIWTVTHTCRIDDEEVVKDYPCRVTFWQPAIPLPWENT